LRYIAANKLKDATDFAHLGGAMKPVTFVFGQAVVTQGEMGDAFFIIQTGTAAVSVDGKIVAPLGVGDYFGETALLKQAPRLATVTATSPLVCLSLDRALFQELFGGKGFVARRSPILCLSSTYICFASITHV
jgi:CRP-like cAMP-binding protein